MEAEAFKQLVEKCDEILKDTGVEYMIVVGNNESACAKVKLHSPYMYAVIADAASQL